MPIYEERYFTYQELITKILDTITSTDFYESKYSLIDNTKTIDFRFSRKDGAIGIAYGNNKFQYVLNTKKFDKDNFINFLTFILDHVQGIIEESWKKEDDE